MLNDLNPQTDTMIEIRCTDHWQVYYRLQELEIPCCCSYHQPLKVQVSSAIAAIQIWSIVQHVTLPRQALVQRLNACWRSST
ncbi:MAG: Asr1405/Asl0597 family protein [Stenomitos frigidus ULC029]